MVIISQYVLCCAKLLSHVRLFATPWTVTHQAPLSMEFSRREYWNGLPCPPPGDLPNPGTEPVSLTSLALAGMFFTTSATWKAHHNTCVSNHHIVHLELTQRHMSIISQYSWKQNKIKNIKQVKTSFFISSETVSIPTQLGWEGGWWSSYSQVPCLALLLPAPTPFS